MTKEPKDFWDKMGVLSTVSIPVVVAVVGFVINSTLKKRELQAEYVKLAVGVLQNTDTAHTVAELRKWAVNVLDDLGPVKLSPELRRAFEQGEVQLPATYPGNPPPYTANPWASAFLQRVSLTSAPSVGLTVVLNGETMGVTPVDTALRAGPLEIEWVSQEGRRVCSMHTTLERGDVLRAVCNTETGRVTERRRF